MAFRIALVDDDPDFTALVRELLSQQGWDVVVCHTEDDAVSCILDPRADVAILDIRMSNRDSGWRILEELQSDPGADNLSVIVCSAAVDDIRAREEWLADHHVATLHKPFDIDDLVQMVERSLPDHPGERSHGARRNGDAYSA